MNIDILGISELKWTEMGGFNSDDHYMQTAKASRKQSSLSGKESAQGCIPKRLLGPCSQLPDAPHLGLSCPALSWFSALSSFAWEPLLLQCLACREGMAQPNFASQPPGRGQGC